MRSDIIKVKGGSALNIGQLLKEARTSAGFTQEYAAEQIQVSRQTISNWENEKSYPDVISVIKLSDLYNVSLDKLLKGDDKMLKHIDESTEIVSSNKKLIGTILLGIMIFAALFACSFFVPENDLYLAGVFVLAIIGISILMYQIIRRI